MTGVAALFVLLRLLAVAHYDWHTAFALLHTLDFEDAPAIFLGTFMANEVVSSVLLVAILPFTVFAKLTGRAHPEERAQWVGSALLSVVLVSLIVAHVRTFHSWGLLIGIAVLAVLIPLVQRGRSHPRVGKAVEFVLQRSRLLAATAALACAAAVSTPWVPLERIETTTEGTRDYYVFDVSPGFLKVLTEDEHAFHIFRDDEVRSRTELTEH
ncbi:hypothetical protein BJP25_13550 [Actinokineospora bangkokensis]|uniref:Uncharacterized protein n=1 Tax=Actinokineospora bangkokensis TaxID=1193682 RepID=A0A1Q9LPX8_9PSEU|nr:hypothetical protein BJP25_13550 [Actinokineospora bangkokensis]